MSKKKKSGGPRQSKPNNPSPDVSPSGQPIEIASVDVRRETTPPPTLVSSMDDQNKSMLSRYVSFGLLLGVIALLGLLFYEVMAQFLIPLFLSALLVVVFRPLYQWVLEKTGGREKIAAMLTATAVLVAVLGPIGALFVMAAAEGRQVYGQFNATRIVEGVREVRTNLKLDMPSQPELRQIENELLELQQNIIALSEAEKDRHQRGLWEVEQAGKRLAQAQGFLWPGDVALEPDENAELTDDAEAPSPPLPTDWENFVHCLGDARNLHENIPLQIGIESMSPEALAKFKQSTNAALHDYQVKLNETADYFSDFRVSFLGGKIKAWAIELVNPSDNQSEAYATTFVNYLREKFFKISGAGLAYAGSLMLGLAIMIIGFYFFLIDGPKMIEAFKGLSPIDDDHEQELVAEFGRVSRAVVVATLLSALVQGLLAGVGFYFTGLDSIFLLTVLSAVLAMVPFVGAAAVWFPCCLYLYFFDNNLVAAIGLGVYGIAIISMADNVIKPYILHGQSNLHPLFALLSVLGGVTALGPIGILIGPMVVAFLQTLLKILQREMSDLERMSHEAN